MNIILGASGQIGSMLAANLLKKGQPVRAVVRSAEKGKHSLSSKERLCLRRAARSVFLPTLRII